MKNKNILFMLLPLFLAACSPSTSTALPTVVLSGPSASSSTSVPSNTGGVSASGKIVPEQEAQLGFTLAGSIKIVDVHIGDIVKVGQVLAEMENTTYQLDLEQAQRNLAELTSPASQAAAAQILAVTQQDLKDQQDKVDSQFFRRASDTLIDKTQGEIDLAKQALARASDAYRLVARLADGDSRKAAALVAMTNAQINLNNLLAKYNWYAGKPTEIDAALAKAKLDVAKAAVQEAEWYLAAVMGESVPADATGSNLARLELARDAVKNAQDRLDHTRIISPIPGAIIKINGVAGEFVNPGEAIFVISDITRLHVETTDLSERDITGVKVGQNVSINVKALNTTVTGKVTAISPVADLLGGDVVYKTWIDIDNPPDRLLAGMSVDVQYESIQ